MVIAGPTASGKSALALKLAEACDGAIINADSQQRYRDFPILTAQPTQAEQARVPHRLFGDLTSDAVSSAAEWATKAAVEIDMAVRAGRLPIVVGGTGLYLRTLMEGLADIPPVPAEVREAARALMADIGNAAFHQQLAARDPASAARIPPGNTQRLIRAWEVIEATGKPLSVWQQTAATPVYVASYLRILLLPPRADVVEACETRFGAMLTHGAWAEVAAALAKGVTRAMPAMNALGARELADAIEGHSDVETAIAAAQIATRQYAKRQSTWFRHQFDADLTLHRRPDGESFAEVHDAVAAFLSKDFL